MTGRDFGNVSTPGFAIPSWSAGRARTTSNPAERPAQSTGRRMTRSTIPPQIRPSPPSRRRRLTNVEIPGARQRPGHLDERRARPRARRRSGTRQDLRRRDVGRQGKRGRVRPQHAPPAQRRPAMTIRVLVADDQSMVRAGFRMSLAGEEDIEVVAGASNGLEAVDKAARFDPTVVLMDIRMPELDGLEATRRVLGTDNP